MEPDTRIRVYASPGCEVLRHVDAVDRLLAEGGKRETQVAQNLLDLVEEEKRRKITDPYQCFLYDTKTKNKKGNFKGNQGEEIVQRVRDIANGHKHLDLSNFAIFDDYMTLLAPFLRSRMCTLTSINLSGTKISVNGALVVARAMNSKLQTLQFSSNAISFEEIRKTIAQRKEVNVSNGKYQHLDAAAIGVFLEEENKYERLDVSENQLTGPHSNIFHGVGVLIGGFKKCITLKEINFRASELRAEGLIHLSNSLKVCKNLTTLRLSGNKLSLNSFGDKYVKGIESFCQSLWEAPKLVEIDLSNNQLDYVCSMPIAEMLKLNCTLKTLNLNNNPLFDAGAAQICEGLHRNTTLIILNLSNCELRCESLIALGQCLQRRNRTLESIDLRQNMEFRSKGFHALMKSLEINSTVANIFIESNDPIKYAKLFCRIEDLLKVNRTFQGLRKNLGHFNLSDIPEKSRINLVQKLNALSEQELDLLLASHSLDDSKISEENISNLRYFSSMELYAPLKRLLWILDSRDRHKNVEKWKQKQQEESEDDIWDIPLC